MRKPILLGVLMVLPLLAVTTQPATATFDGEDGRIAFRRFLDQEQTWGAVFTIRPDGTGERQVTHPRKGLVDRNPDVSPDGRRIVFEREAVDCGERCYVDDVFVVNVDGTGLRKLTGRGHPNGRCRPKGGACSGSPGWSPDGKRIVYKRASGPVRNDLVRRQALYIMDADGSNKRRITQKRLPATGEDTDPQWSPDGRRILFQRFNVRSARPKNGTALWILNLRTGREHRVTKFALRAGDTPDWSPDGRRILFHDNVDNPEESANLYTIAPSGRRLQQLTFADDGVTHYLGSSYSPSGKWIVFGRRPATGGPEANAADVFVVRVDGTDERPLTRTRLYDSYPDWGPKR